MLKHRGKEKIKAGFTITFLNIKKLDKSLNGSTIYLDWKRSSKPGASGVSKRALVSNGEANWAQEPVSFTSTFFKEQGKSDKFDKKLLQLVLIEDVMKNKKQTKKQIIKTKVDLSQFVKKHDVSETLTVSFKKDKDSPILKFILKAHWMKLNNKLLIKADETTKTDKDHVVDIEGTEYILKTDSNASESTVDTMSVISDLEKDEMEGSFLENANDEERNNLMKELGDENISSSEREGWKLRVDEMEAESLERLKTIQSLQKDLDFLRKQSQTLKQENSEKTKKLAAAEQEKEDLSNQLVMLRKGTGGSSSDSAAKSQERLNDRIKKLKEQNEEKEKNIMLLEEELERSKKQLERLKGQNEGSAKVRVSELELALEEKDKLIAQHEHDIKRLKRKKEKESNDDSVSSPPSRGSTKDSESPESKQSTEEYQMIEKQLYTAEPLFTNNISNSASTIFRTLLSWKAFQAPRSKFLIRLIDSMDSAVKRSRCDNEMLCYWLSTTTTLLFKFTKEKSNFVSSSSPKNNAYDSVAITKFENNLLNIVQNVYDMLVRNLYKELDAWLVHSVLEQKPSDRSSITSFDSFFLFNHRKVLTQIFLQSKMSKVHGIIGILSRTLDQLQNSFVADSIVSQLFVQLFFYMDAVLFNALEERKEFCTCTNGFQIKLELSEIIEGWILQKQAFLHKTKDEFKYITQAATILVMDKSNLGEKQVLEQICPSLNYYQVKHILEQYRPDQLSPDPVPTLVIHQLTELCTRNRLTRDSIKLDTGFMYSLTLSSFLGK